MTTHERIRRAFRRKPGEQADRVSIVDYPWPTTLRRWHREGLPENAPWDEYVGADLVEGISMDNGPRYPSRVIEETDQYTIRTTTWGATQKNWKHITSTPEWIDYTVKDRDTWRAAKDRMAASRERINWAALAKNFKTWREQGRWINCNFSFGFDVTHARLVGTERLLMALAEDSDWCVEIFNHQLDVDIALAEMLWQAGYEFDAIRWPDDLGYKGHTFMSPAMYRELLRPVHQRAIDWAHSKGIYACMHSCGDVRTLIGDFVEIGLDSLNPLEVKAGVDPLAVKKQFGDRLVLHGGFNAVLWDNIDAMEAEIRAKLPAMKAGGGYIWATDHSIPDVVSFDDFQRIVGLVKELGQY